MPLILDTTQKAGKLDVIERRIGRLIYDDPSLYTQISQADDPAAAGTLSWDADFSGASGSAFRTTDWVSFGTDTSGDFRQGPPRSTNVFHDGSGNLILRSKRESPMWQGENSQFGLTMFSGAWVGTANYGTIGSNGTSWPPGGTPKHTVTPPFAVEARTTYPSSAPGMWGGMWLLPANKNATTQGIIEIDFGEERLAVPTSIGFHMHWTGYNASNQITTDSGAGAVGYAFDGSASGDLRNIPHVYRVEIFPTGTYAMRPRFFIDGALAGVGPVMRNAPSNTGALQTDIQMMVLIDWRQAPFGAWGANSTKSVTASGTTFTSTSHGLANGTRLYIAPVHPNKVLSGGSGISMTTQYYVINTATNTFSLSLTSGGSAINVGTNLTSGKIGVSGVNYPADSDLGPWDLTVDYVKTYDLTGVTPP